MKVIITGGVAGGATAATRIRRLDEHAEIIIFERSGYISYANCGLPYYIGGVIEDAKELTLQTPESFRQRFRIDVRVHHEVIHVDPERKSVTVRDLETGREFEESYDKLLLSPGARPIHPDLPGADSERIFSLRTVEDTLRIRRFVEERHPKTAAMIGGGFIGLEVAENLQQLGIQTTVIQRDRQLLKTFDYDMAAIVHQKLRARGIELKLNRNVTGFESTQAGIRIQMKEEAPVQAELVLVAIGVTPENALAKEAGLQLGIKGAIVVNDKMETSKPDIYAVGDAVQVRHAVSGKDAVIALAGPANKQGRIAADNICGLDSHFRGSMGSSVIKLFDLTAASTGLTEQAARDAGFACDRVVLFPPSHAGYYPGSDTMAMKVVFERTTLRLLGAQVLGTEGVDKRLDVLASAIQFGIRGDQLKDLDLAYAPPYSSAKDPVNMAGYMIENVAAGRVRQFHWNEVDCLPRDGRVTLLDVRTPEEYEQGHVNGFVNIPLDELRNRLSELEASRSVYVMCQSGLRSYLACRILTQKGFDCYNLSGGYRFYSGIVQEKDIAEHSYPCGMDR